MDTTGLNTLFWHHRFIQQALWTQNLRRYLYGRVKLASAQRILEVGCGTGAVLAELTMQAHGEVYGLDISPEHLQFAADNLPGISLILGDGHALPFAERSFDVTLCHFLLLWVHHPLQIVREMARVTRPGGGVIALAEPDYGGRIDYPSPLSILGEWQQNSLRQQGANPQIGREIRACFQQAGLNDVETGVLGGQWSGKPSPEDWEMEWEVVINDLQQIPSPDRDLEISRLKNIDHSANERGERILYVPTFYAWGKSPQK